MSTARTMDFFLAQCRKLAAPSVIPGLGGSNLSIVSRLAAMVSHLLFSPASQDSGSGL